MSYNNDLLTSLNGKIERLINILQCTKDLEEIKKLLKEANKLKEFELQMKYPEEFRQFKQK